MIALTIALAVLVGVSLGVLGGGGSILTVPLLAYVAGLDYKQAIATSLLVVGITSVVGAIAHARAGRVRWRIAAVFGITGMVAAYAGGLLARFVSGTVLMVAFSGIMIAAAIAMLRGRKNVADTDGGGPHLSVRKIALLGTTVGVLSGLVGAGGGFLLVPALALFGGLAMPAAIGTSLVVIAMQSFAGLAGHLASAPLDWQMATMVTAAAVVGSLVGGRLTAVIEPTALRQGFGWFVLLMASVVLAEETKPVIGMATATFTAVAAGICFGCIRYAICPLSRLFRRPLFAAAAG